MTTASLSISLLGPLRVVRDGAPVSDFKYNKARALLAYLAVEAGAPHPRAELCALLWPELPERSARRNLTQVLTALRDTLGGNETAPARLLASTESVQLNPDVAPDIDAARFNALLDDSERHPHRSRLTCSACAERLREAMALYRGDFLSQLFVADSAPFEEWALVWRERLRQRAMSALEQLIQRAEWCGDYRQAGEYARRLVELDPLRDVSQRELMRMLALDGQGAAAEAQYEQLRRTLANELDVEPEAETARLHESIRAGRLESLRRHAAPPVNGPLPPNALIGREQDVQTVCDQLRAVAIRALTLTGSAGVGKTRLALAAAHALRFDFEDGVHFVELAPAAEAAVLPAIAEALGVKEKAGQPLAATLTAWLKPRHTLLVLDNFEHVLDAAALVADLLAACPAVKVLITSRAPLRIRAEQRQTLAPLAEAEAVQLFSERAHAARPTFALTPENAETIAALCAQVDYLPLAIELIAVRARTLSLTELRQQLDQPLDALSRGARDLPARHRTLRDAIRWSFDRLTADEQRAFAHLGVFAGGYTAEAAQAVVSDGLSVLPVLEVLTESSLVHTRLIAGETRFALLETLREFALEQLTERGDASIAAQQRHAGYFTRLAERARPELDGPDQLTWFDRLEREHLNLRGALTWSLAHDLTLGLQLAVALMRFWSIRGYLSEGRRWLHDLMTSGDSAPEALRAEALVVASRLAYVQGDFRAALELAQSGQELSLQLENDLGIAQALLAVGFAHLGLGDYVSARAHVEESLALCRGEADQPGIAEAFKALGHIALRQGDYAAAKAFLGQALELYRGLNDPRNTAGLSLNLGVAAFEQGDYETARRLTEASLTVFRRLRDTNDMATALLNLGNTFLVAGDLDRARGYFEEAIVLERLLASGNVAIPLGGLGRVLRRLGDLKGALACFAESLQLRLQFGDRRGVAVTLTNFAHVEHDDHQPDRAARLLGAAEAIRQAIGAPIHPNRREEYERLVTEVRAALGEAGFADDWAEGRALTLEQAVQLAIARGP